MPADISSYLADQIACQRAEAIRGYAATAPASHQAAIRHVLRELEVLPTAVAESHLTASPRHPGQPSPGH